MHLQHKIPWKELVHCLRIDDTEITLPVGECGRIHLIDKATKMKVLSRKFLTNDQICTSNDCGTTTNLRSFSKNKLTPPTLSASPRRHIGWRKDKLKYINEKFSETVMEFVASEEKKFNVVKHFTQDIVLEAELLYMRCIECRQYPCTNLCQNFLVFSLYSNYEIEKLLWLDSIGKVNVRGALSKTYGGQAIGNGYMYLVLHHLLPFYVRSNAILACGYENDEHKWGELQSNAHFRRRLEYDNDFLTFIPALRPYLHKDVYMKDMKKTMELLRLVFRHIYVYIFLIKRFNCYCDVITHDLKIQWYFGFPGLD